MQFIARESVFSATKAIAPRIITQLNHPNHFGPNASQKRSIARCHSASFFSALRSIFTSKTYLRNRCLTGRGMSCSPLSATGALFSIPLLTMGPEPSGTATPWGSDVKLHPGLGQERFVLCHPMPHARLKPMSVLITVKSRPLALSAI